MATTWLKSIKLNRGKSMGNALTKSTNYIKNENKTTDKSASDEAETAAKPDEPTPDPIREIICNSTAYSQNPVKADNIELVRGYECDPRTVTEEFLLAKKEYFRLTGRDNGKKNILAYHIRQSFLPGEIDPQKALDIGYELALRWTKGKHAFIVAVHTDKAHIHSHIIYNSTTLDCRYKYKNFFLSSFALRRLSDLICLENGLSIIANPKLSKGKNYAKWLGDREPSWQEKLRRKIDEVLPGCNSFEDFRTAMKAAEYTISDKRKILSFLAPGQKNPTRLNAKTLGEDYTEMAIRVRIENAKTIGTMGGSGGHVRATDGGDSNIENAPARINLLIDIQAKIHEGKGPGYEHWARIFNLKEAAKTLLFLRDNAIDSYDDLLQKTAAASAGFSELNKKIKSIEGRLKDISELQKQIGTYRKTRDTYAQYKKSGWSAKFLEEHRAAITLHRASKKHFDSLGLKKLPKISELKQEYARLSAENKKLYSGYHADKKNMQALLIARGNAERILGIKPQTQAHDISRPVL